MFLNRIVILSALGYFVDILDLFLFSVLRVPSLRDLGVAPSELMSQGILLLNAQMAGLLVGCFFWGVLGDRKGRVKVLYGSILLYSVATCLNAFVTSIEQYAVLRFVAGLGLSGELGAAITLVSETLPTEKRGLGTTLVAGFGLCGGIVAAVLAQHFSWQTCYLIGGVSGLLLLALRFSLTEPQMYLQISNRTDRGSLKLLLGSSKRVMRLVQLILVGVPIWFVSGILIVFSPEFGKILHITSASGESVTAPNAVLYSYVGVALGDFITGGLSQWLRSRKKVVMLSLLALAVCIGAYLNSDSLSLSYFYAICFALGLGTGYWAVLVTMAAEQFGTNLRATVTTLVPNLVRASVIPVSAIFEMVSKKSGILSASRTVGYSSLLIALLALWGLTETFHRKLDFVEERAD